MGKDGGRNREYNEAERMVKLRQDGNEKGQKVMVQVELQASFQCLAHANGAVGNVKGPNQAPAKHIDGKPGLRTTAVCLSHMKPNETDNEADDSEDDENIGKVLILQFIGCDIEMGHPRE